MLVSLSCFLLSLRQPLCPLVLEVELSQHLNPSQCIWVQDRCLPPAQRQRGFFSLFPCPTHSEFSHVSQGGSFCCLSPRCSRFFLLKEEHSRPGLMHFPQQNLLFSPSLGGCCSVPSVHLFVCFECPVRSREKSLQIVCEPLQCLCSLGFSAPPTDSRLGFRNSQTFSLKASQLLACQTCLPLDLSPSELALSLALLKVPVFLQISGYLVTV